MSDTPEMQHWLRRLDWALHSLPPTLRTDIVREVRSHFDDRAAQGIGEASTIAALGQPESYAAQFVDDFRLSESLGTRSVPGMLKVAARLAGKRALVAAGLLLVLVLVLVAGASLTTAAMRLFDPQHWGLWLSDHFLVLGRIDPGDDARELLGAAIYPVSICICWLCWAASRWILSQVLRRQLPDPRNRNAGGA